MILNSDKARALDLMGASGVVRFPDKRGLDTKIQMITRGIRPIEK